MARIPYVKNEIEVPSDVNVTVTGKKVKVTGSLGSLEKDFSYAKDIIIRKDDNRVIIEAYFADKKTYSTIGTISSHIRNMIEGVRRGFRYKMKIVYAHFPMNIKVDKNKNILVIENFLGRRGSIIVKILPGVNVKVSKDDVIIEGIDKEAVAQTAANIREATKLRGKFRMSPHGREGGGPGILDGIYLYAREYMK